MAEPVGPGPTRLAHRVLRDVLRHPRRGCGHQRRRDRPQLPAPREPARAVRGALRHQAVGELLRPHRPPPHRRAQDVKVAQELHHHPRGAEDVHRQADQVFVPPPPVVGSHGPDPGPGGRRGHGIPADGGGGHRGEDVCRIFPFRQGRASRARMRRGIQRRPGAYLGRRGARAVLRDRRGPRGGIRRDDRQHQHARGYQIAQGTRRGREQVPGFGGRRRRQAAAGGVRGEVRDDDSRVPRCGGDHRRDRSRRHRRRRRRGGRVGLQGGGDGAGARPRRQIPRRD
mmetsp:Transcript_12963/g.52193  ORF Transcript_12963/g.52193 Transcript_12963/m.52193 type:complete len:284 (+) Transcript_12963:956-1807(+)